MIPQASSTPTPAARCGRYLPNHAPTQSEALKVPVIRIDLDDEELTALRKIAGILEIHAEEVAEMAVEVFLNLHANGQLELIQIPEVLN